MTTTYREHAAAGLAIAVVRRIDAAQRAMLQAPSMLVATVPARPDGGVVL